MLEVRLFGNPEILLDGQPVKLNRRRSRALLFYLADSPQPQRRESLQALIWPEAERLSAQQVLRTTLHGLRQALDGALLSEGDLLELSTGTRVDTRIFLQTIEGPTPDLAGLKQAIDLYRGDFLAGFYLPDAPEYEEWLSLERERYRRLAFQASRQLSQLYEASGDYLAALESLERALAADPLQEDLQREAIRLLYLTGDRPGAIRRYDHLRRLLDDEMGVPPMGETRQMYDAILNDTLSRPTLPASPPPPAPAPGEDGSTLPFTGRLSELETLEALGGSHQLILIEGEPGIGKTRLAFEYLRRLEAIPLIGAAHELEHNLPYQPVAEGLRSLLRRPDWPALLGEIRASLAPIWLDEAAYLLPELSPHSQAERRPPDEPRLWEGISQLVLALARLHPLAIFIDDLQWADSATLGLLGYLVRQASQAPVTFLAATRPVTPRAPLATLIQALTRSGRLARLPLGRLNETEVAAASRSLAPEFAYPLASWLMKNSEGNPFVLAELVRYARQNGILQPNGVVNLNALSDSPVVPQGVYSLIQSRLAHVSEPARRILEAAVAAGREFEFEVVARAAGLSELAALDALAELQSAGLIHPLDESRYAFDHSLISEVIYRELGEPRHRLMHRRIAEAMESLFSPARLAARASVVAWHLSEGGAPERAASYAAQAGQQAVALGAWNEAIPFFELALNGTEGELRWPVLMALGEARTRAGRPAEAVEAYHDAVNLAQALNQPDQVAQAKLALGQALLRQARFAEAIQLARQVAASGPEAAHQAAEFLWGTALSLEGADLEEAAAHLQRAEAPTEPQDIAGRVLAARIRFELGSVAAQQGNLEKAVAFYRETLKMACSQPEEPFVTWCILAHNNLAYHLLLQGDPQALGIAQEGMRLAREKGDFTQQTYLYSTLGEILLQGGQVDEAEAAFRQGLGLAEQLGMQERVAGLNANLGLVAARRGQTALAIHRLSLALARAETLGTLHLAAQIRLWLAPLLPHEEAEANLAAVRLFAKSGGRKLLLKQVEKLEQELGVSKT